MRAWQFIETGKPIELIDLPDPAPASGEVVVEVRAVGLCHSDVGFCDGEMTWMLAKTPIVLGHEVAGVISALGDGVDGFAVGDRVGVAGDGLNAPGIGADGGFAEKCIGKVGDLVAIPDQVSFSQAAVGTDAGMTSYHAVRGTGGVGAGTKVGIVGLGGLGLTGARIAVASGAEVYAAEVNPGVHALAMASGVKEVVSDISELAGRDLDVVVDFAGFETTVAGAIGAVRAGGRIVVVGLGVDAITLSQQQIVLKEIEIVGSLGGRKPDVEAVYDLMARGELEILTSPVPFDQLDSGLDLLRHGGVRGRLVAHPSGE